MSNEMVGRNRKNDDIGRDKRKIKTRQITKDKHTAEVINSSNETAEQRQLKIQNKAEYGLETYFTIESNGNETASAIFIPNELFEREDLSFENGIASFTDERLKDLIHEYSIEKGGELNQNYSKGYVAYISPTDFLSLTTTNDSIISEDAKRKYYKLDLDTLKNSKETPYLRVDFETGRVLEHQGRHRMSLLRDAGIEKVAFVIEDIDESKKYKTKKHEGFSLKGQRFPNGTAPGFVVLDEVIPLSPTYRNEVTEKFVENKSDIKYSVPFTAEEQAIEGRKNGEITEEEFAERIKEIRKQSADDGGIDFKQESKKTAETLQRVQRRNEYLTEENKNLRELLNLQGKVTGGKLIARQSLIRIANKLMREENTVGERNELISLLEEYYSSIVNAEELNIEKVLSDTSLIVVRKKSVFLQPPLGGYFFTDMGRIPF